MNDQPADTSSEPAAKKPLVPNPIKPGALQNKFPVKPVVQKKSFMQSRGAKGGGAIRQMRSQRGR